MKTFNIYKHPAQGIEAVKVGFSWPAFFFGFIWMLVKKLWGFAGAWFVSYMLLAIIEAAMGQTGDSGAQLIVYLILFVGYLALWLFPAFKGNQWREANLSKRGYQRIATVQADSPDAATAQAATSP
jgi:uncharacterized membrane protein YtjA (UPF0391 family)